MVIVRGLTIAILLPALGAGCAVRFQQPEPSAPHAVLELPSQAVQWERRMFFEPLELDGRVRPRNWLVEHLRIPPGESRLLARVADDARQGACLLQFAAVAGETYRLDAGLAADTFTIELLNGGVAVASCDAPATMLPTPARIPGTPLR